jgi:tRNA A37 methylthiotransferase MiaB
MGLRRKVNYLRIGWGCEERCTYCVEWRAVGGKFVSKPLEVCLEEVKNGRAKGYKNFVIIADSPGQWGVDLGKKFPDLLRAILDVDPEINIANIDGIHPHSLWQYRDEFNELLKTKRIKSIMSPLQSGSDRILELMKRRYSKQQFVDLIKTMKAAYPDLVLITQVIVGFPSETFAEFKESVDLVTDLGFTNATFFPYYSNPLTVSHRFEGKIGDQEKFNRVTFALKEIGKRGILSANFGVEINPRYQKVKALYD